MAFPESVAFNYNFKFDDEAELQNIRFIESSLLEVFAGAPLVSVEIPNKSIRIESRHSLFTFKYQCKIQYDIVNNKPKVSAEVTLTELLKIIIIVSITTAFLATFSFSTYLWFIFIFSIAAYLGNVLFIRMYLFERFDTAFNQLVEKTEELAKQQKKWMQNSEVCPACGELLTQYDKVCPDCGIVLGYQVPTKPFDVSKYAEKSILYHFKPLKKG